MGPTWTNIGPPCALYVNILTHMAPFWLSMCFIWHPHGPILAPYVLHMEHTRTHIGPIYASYGTHIGPYVLNGLNMGHIWHACSVLWLTVDDAQFDDAIVGGSTIGHEKVLLCWTGILAVDMETSVNEVTRHQMLSGKQ